MNVYQALYRISKTLHLETDRELMIRLLLDQVIAFTGAAKGFIVVRERGSFQEKYRVHYDPETLPPERRNFSRSLVRQAIRSGELFIFRDISMEQRFAREESVMALGGAAVAVAPLRFRGQVNAVIYLEKEREAGAFSEQAAEFINEFVDLAGASIHRELEREDLRVFKQAHEGDFLASHDFAGIIGRHPTMVSLLQTVVQAARSEATVLIRGETGTGKDLIARALCRNSRRADKPFVAIHCGALPETLFEAELFGHMRGSFTGAVKNRPGRVAQADGGTLFIDEVAEIPLSSQAKLLRFFQSGEFQRIGSDKVEQVDVRIVAATHRDLERMTADGEFRQDLYYRLKVVELEAPPLRARRSDIPLLIERFLEERRRRDRRELALDAEAMQALELYDYPGNVRELMHLIERASVLARDGMVGLENLPESVRANFWRRASAAGSSKTPRFSRYDKQELKTQRDAAIDSAVERVERAFIRGLLERAGGNVSEAARCAGLQRTYLHRLIAKYK